ncbi:hypothetical protein GSY69_00880 [Brevibacterium sp. 5221]|uniref:Endonuclease/exonuclease/phosphatase domain-containing protein n=1 Tax=Brevibacterium rongguiense TaxID=2695267 RepID=A0A6N9H3G5_9MICO|nr:MULTISPECIES: hypothetical protein [Brevibacterium]MYM18568.1 hypothetical protein [Brevibacterium rongguiense]WAL39642.1 hypothetical protein BRM1_10270 [Brevibacterium sp. BRM-1]
MHTFAGAGYDDFLAHSFGHWAPTAATPSDRINADFPTFNGYSTQVKLAPKNGLGSTIDWMVGSSGVAVKQWETVVDVKSRTATAGVLASTPSDHQMIRATVALG